MIAVVVGVLLLGGGVVAAILLAGGDDDPEEVTTSTSELEEAVDDLSSEVEDAFDDLPTETASESGASGEGDEAPGEDASVFDLTVGDCFNTGSTSDEVQQVGVVPCEEPHDAEVFHLVSYPDDGTGFPGLEVLNDFAAQECQGQPFADYVGIAYAESRFFTNQLTPTEGSWEQGDREIVCLLYDATTQLDFSVRGSAQ